MFNVVRILIIICSLLIPMGIIFLVIKIWESKSKNMTQKEREESLAKIAIAGTIITSFAILYAIIFNFYNLEQIYKIKS